MNTEGRNDLLDGDSSGGAGLDGSADALKGASPTQAPEGEKEEDMTFELDASEEGLLEEFGVLMAAEYNYGITRNSGSWVLPPDITIQATPGATVLPPAVLNVNLKTSQIQPATQVQVATPQPAGRTTP